MSEVIKHGKFWILEDKNHRCPDCMASSDVIDWSIEVKELNEIFYRNIKFPKNERIYILDSECQNCGCEWIVTRVE